MISHKTTQAFKQMLASTMNGFRLQEYDLKFLMFQPKSILNWEE